MKKELRRIEALFSCIMYFLSSHTNRGLTLLNRSGENEFKKTA